MPDDKKIIIDEDWKAQVQAEKEAAAKSRSLRMRRKVEPTPIVGLRRCADAAGFA